VHRSVVCDPDGRVTLGATKILGMKAGRTGNPSPPRFFGFSTAMLHRMGDLFSRCRVVERAPGGPGRWFTPAGRLHSTLRAARTGRCTGCSRKRSHG
jgi:hypothetical protein